ncbi:hypothetical protein [Streptomyces beihaiensis]|uniref:Uncharacterized protein n=1 Tax=Streptomyces beihaiensis TaxID=2984495 RepID=A0ABT3U2T7_9ACTN|nr:hypothetical protein [Streptomyces beihaiensis]MCX3062575.1 hypothetical protein [Streptomyces beihaiensis]
MSRRVNSYVRTARRRAGDGIRALRTWLMVRVFLPRRTSKAALLRYAAFLDGQTLNLHAELPGSPEAVDWAQLMLRRRGSRHAVPVTVYESQGRLLMDAAVLFGDEAGGLPVGHGRWKMRLKVRTRRRTRTLPLVLRSVPTPTNGPTRAREVSPRTGDRYRLGRTVRGDARVVCSAANPAAELAGVHVAHARIEVDLYLFGVYAEEPVAEFVARGRSVDRPLAEVVPGLWRADVPLGEMVPDGAGRQHWDVLVHVEGVRRPLRLARRLHDVYNLDRVFGMREITVAPRPRNLMVVEPRYTPAGNFRLTCRRGPEGA